MLAVILMSIFSASALTDLPADYRSQTFTVEHPLVLEYRIGTPPNDRVYLHVVNYPNKRSDLFFFHMHMTEYTAKAAGEEAVRALGGTFMYLVHPSGVREMHVTLDKTPYKFDPNRVFTDEGFKKSLGTTPPRAHWAQLVNFREWVKRNIQLARGQRRNDMVIALHNNSDDDRHGKLLSILTEKEIMNLDNRAVNQNPAWDIDNFFIATLVPTYELLLRGFNPNVSLRMENPRPIGYLSNWMIDEGINYINVETQIDDVDGNRDMVEKLQNLF